MVLAAGGNQRRQLGQAPFDPDRAPWRERAARRPPPGAGRDTVHPHQPGGALRRGHGPQQPAGVGVLGGAEHLVGGAELDHPARVDDGNPIGELADDHHVVADIHRGDAVLDAQALHGLQNRALGRHVQAGGRLVQHDQPRPAREGDRDPDALLLPTGELVRVGAKDVGHRGEPDLAQQLVDPRVHLGLVPAVRGEGLGQLRPDPAGRVQCRRRVLRYVGHRRATQGQQIPRRQGHQVGAVHHHRAGADPQPTPGVPDHGQAEGGLPGTGLADNAEDLPRGNRQGDVLDDLRPAPCRGDGEVVDDHTLSSGHDQIAASAWPVASISTAFSARSTPSATRVTASVKVFTPMVSTASRIAGASTAHGFSVTPIRFSLIM